jgi:hypothetical protein
MDSALYVLYCLPKTYLRVRRTLSRQPYRKMYLVLNKISSTIERRLSELIERHMCS